MNIPDYEIRLQPSNLYIICEIDYIVTTEPSDTHTGFVGSDIIEGLHVINAYGANDEDMYYKRHEIKSHLIINCLPSLINKYYDKIRD